MCIDRHIGFFKKWHKAKLESFDNTSNNHLYELSEEENNNYIPTPDERDAWTSYLVAKFTTLQMLEEGADIHDVESHLTDINLDCCNEFIEDWAANLEKEILVYYYRKCQLPETILYKTWYDVAHVSAMQEWCFNHDKHYENTDVEALDGDHQITIEKLKGAFDAIGEDPFADHHTDQLIATVSRRAMAGLADRVERLCDCLKNGPNTLTSLAREATRVDEFVKEATRCFNCFGETDEEKAKVGVTLLDSEFLGELNLKLVQSLYDRLDETTLIKEFLLCLQDQFGCEVCDYLDVQDGILRWMVGTVEEEDMSDEMRNLSPEERRIKTAKREQYSKGQGITGSMLLLDPNNSMSTWQHIGSNDVPNDPRQCDIIGSAYETDLYPKLLKATNGKIVNFWMFPIFRKGEIVGAFRVVNKLSDDGKIQPGGWPYIARVEISLIGRWFSKFLDTVEPQINAREDYNYIMSRTRGVKDMWERLELSWLQESAFQSFLRHLSRDISKKKEKRGVGCTILVADVSKHPNAFRDLDNYPLISALPNSIKEPYHGLDVYHDAVDPLLGGYVFTHEGKFVGIKRLRSKANHDVLGPECVKQITGNIKESICLFLPRDSGNIIVCKDGDFCADIRLSETTGQWSFRYKRDILQGMEMLSDSIDTNILSLLTETCLALSSKHWGAMFVIGECELDKTVPAQKSAITFKCNNSYANILEMGVDLLAEFAKMDGSTFISGEGRVLITNRVVTVTDTEALGKDKLGLFADRGARHKAGLDIAQAMPKSIVIVISENGDITLLGRGVEKESKDSSEESDVLYY